MGRSKLDLPWGGRSLLDHAVETLGQAGADPIRAVVSEPRDIRGCVSIVNPRASEGMTTSLACGLHASAAAEITVVHLCDLPTVSAEMIGKLVAAVASGFPAAAACFENTVGPPIVVSQSVSRRLRDHLSNPNARAKTFLLGLDAELERVDLPSAANDVDTPDRYLALHQKTFGFAPSVDFAHGR